MPCRPGSVFLSSALPGIVVALGLSSPVVAARPVSRLLVGYVREALELPSPPPLHQHQSPHVIGPRRLVTSQTLKRPFSASKAFKRGLWFKQMLKSTLISTVGSSAVLYRYGTGTGTLPVL